jgi:hypothetical protein
MQQPSSNLRFRCLISGKSRCEGSARMKEESSYQNLDKMQIEGKIKVILA